MASRAPRRLSVQAESTPSTLRATLTSGTWALNATTSASGSNNPVAITTSTCDCARVSRAAASREPSLAPTAITMCLSLVFATALMPSNMSA